MENPLLYINYLLIPGNCFVALFKPKAWRYTFLQELRCLRYSGQRPMWGWLLLVIATIWERFHSETSVQWLRIRWRTTGRHQRNRFRKKETHPTTQCRNTHCPAIRSIVVAATKDKTAICYRVDLFFISACPSVHPASSYSGAFDHDLRVGSYNGLYCFGKGTFSQHWTRRRDGQLNGRVNDPFFLHR